ncbi:esterase [Sorangium cellulosum]|uniref:Esterase n=1 Tax=Sorangium cellulosum TaxID=56 RepID=A0A2L0F4Y8_SORCE|nr:alpha/beta hydrolase family protein [Sorangium cellulosum]AUX46634.1 esterase [Sorangium cellulosum]
MAKKTTFVLVHGAWHGAWCYKRVAAPLRARGHEVHAPTLTGLAERSHLLDGAVNVSTHIADIANLLRWEELTDVVLCGHSYGGMVITGVAGLVPDRIRSMVYVDAYLPEEGQNMLDMVPEVFQKSFQASASRNGGVLVPAIPAELLAVNPRDRAWVDAQCTSQPYATFVEGVAGRAAVDRIGKRMYIYAAGWGETPFTPIYERLKEDRSWTTHAAPCGHDIMIDMPELLIELLLEAAA